MAGQKYWKKVKGEWVNTLALERAERAKKPIKLAGGGRATHGYGRAYMKGGRVK